MKTQSVKTLALLFIMILSISNLKSQNQSTADLILDDFDDNMPFREFFYLGPDNNRPKAESEIFSSDLIFIKEGRSSRFLEWNNLQVDQYFGWGLDLTGFNASKVKFLSFWVIGTNGNERFEIKMKDTGGKEPAIISSTFINVTKDWQHVKVPVSSFKGINISALENINLGFNYISSGKSGRIYIDDFRFIYE